LKLYFDENFGKGVPTALRLVCTTPQTDIHVEYAGRTKKAKKKALQLGAPDPDWITYVGKSNSIGLSFNVKILENPLEREVILKQKAGIIFFAFGNETGLKTLRFLLNRLDWLFEVDKVPRPFAYRLSLSGHKKQVLGQVDYAQWLNQQQTSTTES